jgi:type III restriction enzyme
METGTGKTYVYLRTALELHRRYGLRKFIVVVPSVAILRTLMPYATSKTRINSE